RPAWRSRVPCTHPTRLRLADDANEITHLDVDIHKMQAPVRQHLTLPNDIAEYVVGARTGWIAVHRHLEIGCIVIGRALRRQQPGNAYPWRVDGPLRDDPRFGRSRSRDGTAIRGEIRVQVADAATERRRVRARGGHVLA